MYVLSKLDEIEVGTVKLGRPWWPWVGTYGLLAKFFLRQSLYLRFVASVTLNPSISKRNVLNSIYFDHC